MGGPDFNPFLMLEVHYNNPGLLAGEAGGPARRGKGRQAVLDLARAPSEWQLALAPMPTLAGALKEIFV